MLRIVFMFLQHSSCTAWPKSRRENVAWEKLFLYTLLWFQCLPKLIFQLWDLSGIPLQQAKGHSHYQNLQALITRSKHTAHQLLVGCAHNVPPLHQRQDWQLLTDSQSTKTQWSQTPLSAKISEIFFQPSASLPLSYCTLQPFKGNSSFTGSIAIFISCEHIQSRVVLFPLMYKEREGKCGWAGMV